MIRLKNDVLKNIQALLPQTHIIKADIGHSLTEKGPSIGDKLISLYGFHTPEVIDVGEEDE